MYNRTPTYGGARQHGRRPRGYRALGLVDAEERGNGGAETPAGTNNGNGGGGGTSYPVTRPGGAGDRPEIVPEYEPQGTAPATAATAEPTAPKEAGFGILGLVIALIFGAALTRLMGD